MTSPGPAEDGPAMAEEFLFGYRKSFSSYSDRVDRIGAWRVQERPYSDMDVDLLDGGRNGYRDHPDVAVLKMKIEEQMHQLSLLQKENKDKGRQSHGLGSGARRYKQMDMEFDDGDDPADQRPLHDQPRYIVDAYSRHFEIDIEGDMDTGHIESENPFPGVNHDDEIVEVKVGGEDEKQLENYDNDPVAAVAIGRAKNSVSRQQSPHQRERFESYLTQQRRAKYRRMSKRRRARRKMSKNRLSALDQERHPGLIPTSVSADDQNWTDRSATPSERYFSEGAEQGASDWSHGLLPSTFSPLWRSHDSLGSFEVAVSYHAE
ncbi:hypothetical protein BSL78_00961 [Apostichopus japonicus]|uniref:Uncharacterized protein n=1 Tax=Stichopus japonicus TaxID=307972 RepID=A0A2G8LP87_STIJA|nr:hypothetical protein BSL78_00961 [Apostichopus japonicus]